MCNGTRVLLGPTATGACGGAVDGCALPLDVTVALQHSVRWEDGWGWRWVPALNILRVLGWYHGAGWRAAACAARPSRQSQRKILFVLPVVMLFVLKTPQLPEPQTVQKTHFFTL